MRERTCPPFAEAYTVKRGDTVSRIAAEFNTTIAVIRFLNPTIDINRISIGQVICVPRIVITPTCPNGSIYTVKAGDTFYRIADEFNITVRELQQANPLVNPYNLVVGQRICIPRRPAPPPPPPAIPPCIDGTYYVIRSGDTFYSIANRFNVTIRELETANPDVNPSNLVVGRIICIPRKVVPPGTPPCAGGAYYTIVSGDTFFSIASRFGVTIRDLEAANPNVDPTRLMIGQIICIPRKPRCPGGRIHVIGTGDTLYTLAQRYDVSFRALVDANPGIDVENLQIGQEICIPPYEPAELCPTGKTYVIMRGDTLSSIAEKFVVSAADILKYNPTMIPSEFVAGRRICIPPEVQV
ncbi:LysM peptidoglycan-binding domain-containing protein [Proteiniborus sp. MB09-C3]|uniref:muramidase family protein n=1 Tax=Proteiniborus sp. MB09-C3 TaxID=3050072 RepID=UPI002555F610|nr:LysM peptidoglycan-binding domain-containing protein [Proteiniborus sp. MB09-C3]WIV12363.1 LysM peptidoglycan-binding domain-containing protein [Proteiniborus sp. MB09-C3]